MSVLAKTAKIVLGAGAVGAALAGRSRLRERQEIDLYDKVVLITGGSRGLGLVMAREFASEGAKLVLCARTEGDLDRAREELESSGAEVLTVRCDVADRAQVRNLIRQATDHFGRIDVLVNNAGIISAGPLESQNIQDFEMAMDIMYWGVVYPSLEVLPQMKERKSGRIVNITSVGGKVSVPHLLAYNSAKHAAVGFSEGLTAEVAKDGIKVTTVVPGVMRTGGHTNAFYKGQHKVEYALFSIMSSWPFFSIPAEQAAREVVQAVKTGEKEITPAAHANILARMNGIMPGTTATIMGLTNYLLPGPGPNGQQRKRGKQSESAISQSFLTEPARDAAEENLELDRAEPADEATVDPA